MMRTLLSLLVQYPVLRYRGKEVHIVAKNGLAWIRLLLLDVSQSFLGINEGYFLALSKVDNLQ
jgi:hypothetical protein